MAELKVVEAETDSMRHDSRSSSPRLCLVLCASNYQCVGVLSKKLGEWFLLFLCVCCGLYFIWDTNVIYSAWHDAVRENWSFPGNANKIRRKSAREQHVPLSGEETLC